VTAVAVWSHQPDADALLDDRLARGWTPTATSTVDGDRIFGHAACRVPPAPAPPTTQE
jgi:hypothetical protein